MASKLKKLVKKLGKAALIGGAGYAALKGFGKKGKAADANDGFREKFMKPSIGMVTDGSNQNMPGNLSKSAGATGPKKRNMYSPGDGLDSYMAKGGRAGLKGGGKAVRGVSKILLKGKR